MHDLSYKMQSNLVGFRELTVAQFKTYTDMESVFYRISCSGKDMDWVNKHDDNATTFCLMTEKEIFDQRVKLYGKEPCAEWVTKFEERLKKL